MKKTLYCYLLLIVLSSVVPRVLKAQPKNISGPAGSIAFGTKVTVLTNGNYVVRDYAYSTGLQERVGAVYLYNGKTHALISTLKGERQYDQIGDEIYALPNGNFVIKSAYWHNASNQMVGAVTWASGITGISGTISAANSIIGIVPDQLPQYGGISVLPSGNFVIAWPGWTNGVFQKVGAATWVNGSTGITGTVSDQNSLVGTTANAAISGMGITVLTNGNYVVGSPAWATWASGTTGITGAVSTANSLSSGGMVTALKNGHYVVASPQWSNGGVNAIGAVTWADGATGLTGNVSAANSLIGSQLNDQVGSEPIVALTNGNYVVVSPYWNNGGIADAGAATWVNGSGPTTGVVSQANSLYGTSPDDRIGMFYVNALTNGNYVVCSRYWDRNGVSDAGAATWGNGATGTTGAVGESNSLVGSATNDVVGGGGAVALTNGNYVVGSPNCKINGNTNAGAATWGNGTTGIVGVVSAANSLVGSSTSDEVGTTSAYGQIVALTNGHYVVSSLLWHGASWTQGAVTWGNGVTGTTGVVSGANSLIDISNYQGETISINVAPLANGNYVVVTPWWTDNASSGKYFGAAILGNGSGGTVGQISPANALVSPMNSQKYGSMDVTALPDGNFVVSSSLYPGYPGSTISTGSATWGNGFTGIKGEMTPCNSIIAGNIALGPKLATIYNPVYDYLICARPGDNIVTIFSPTSKPLGGNAVTGQTNVAGNAQTPLATTDDCQIIAAVQPAGVSPVSGVVNAKSWVEGSVPTYGSIPFVARHYEITPVDNASTATGKVTLFFSQTDFDNFNAAPNSIPKLPIGPDDADGVNAIRIGKYAGTSSNGTGLPGTYSEGVELIDPDDNDIKWNADFQRWEVAFDVTGFSGFILQSHADALPVKLVSFTGSRIEKDVLLQWNVTDAEHFSHFEVEKGTDARHFNQLGTVAFAAGSERYQFIDTEQLVAAEKLYYRLKMVDLDGTYAYSKIINISDNSGTHAQAYLYPNPTTDHLDIMLKDYADETATVQISDVSGRVLLSKPMQISRGKISMELNGTDVRTGIYLIRVQTANGVVQLRVVTK
jgi:hypothetical protein